MTYAADFTLAGTGTFQNQIQMSMVKAAIAIKNEARSIHPALDSKRQTLCTRVLENEANLISKFCFACVETGLSGSPSDAQVDTAVATVWNSLAGVTPADQA